MLAPGRAYDLVLGAPLNLTGSGWLGFPGRRKSGFGVLMLLVALVMAGPPALSKGSSLAGSWSGGGWVSFASGAKEKARCRARYSRAGCNSYELSATTASDRRLKAQPYTRLAPIVSKAASTMRNTACPEASA
jgi:hypothetical protein